MFVTLCASIPSIERELNYAYWNHMCKNMYYKNEPMSTEIYSCSLEACDCCTVRFCMISLSLLFQVTPRRIKITPCSPVWFKPDGSEMYFSGEFKGMFFCENVIIIYSSSCYSRPVWWNAKGEFLKNLSLA